MTARKKGAAPIVLRWQSALQRYRDIPNDSPPRYAVVGIAGVLVSYSDPDGRNCRPAIGTIVWQVGISERTAVQALAWLVEHGWLEVTRRTGTRPTVYRLTIPVPAEEQVPGTADEQDQNTSPVLPRSRTRIESAPAAGTAAGTAPEQDDLRTSEAKAEEEEEGVAARSAVAALATPPVELDRRSLLIVSDIRTHAKVALRAEVVVPAIHVAQQRVPKLGDVALAVYGVDLLKRRGVTDPSGYLAYDFRNRLTATVMWSPRMILADKLSTLVGAIALIRKAHLSLGQNDPLSHLYLLLRESGSVDEDCFDEVPKVWDVKPAHVGQWNDALRYVNDSVTPYLKEAQEMIDHQFGGISP